jgi:hypothetical protein
MKKSLSRILRLFLFLGVFFLLTSKIVHASEGTVELVSQTNKPTKCYATSLRMQNLQYKILFSCRYLIYPVDETIFNYVMWATPRDGGKAIKLGTLGLGKGEFKTKSAFTSLFVSTESNKKTKTPSGNVVLRGNVQPIEFLEEELTPTPTASEDSEAANGEEQVGQEDSQDQEMTTKDKLLLALRRAGIAALFALVALVGIIFVVSRSRG